MHRRSIAHDIRARVQAEAAKAGRPMDGSKDGGGGDSSGGSKKSNGNGGGGGGGGGSRGKTTLLRVAIAGPNMGALQQEPEIVIRDEDDEDGEPGPAAAGESTTTSTTGNTSTSTSTTSAATVTAKPTATSAPVNPPEPPSPASAAAMREVAEAADAAVAQVTSGALGGKMVRLLAAEGVAGGGTGGGGTGGGGASSGGSSVSSNPLSAAGSPRPASVTKSDWIRLCRRAVRGGVKSDGTPVRGLIASIVGWFVSVSTLSSLGAWVVHELAVPIRNDLAPSTPCFIWEES